MVWDQNSENEYKSLNVNEHNNFFSIFFFLQLVAASLTGKCFSINKFEKFDNIKSTTCVFKNLIWGLFKSETEMFCNLFTLAEKYRSKRASLKKKKIEIKAIYSTEEKVDHVQRVAVYEEFYIQILQILFSFLFTLYDTRTLLRFRDIGT